MGMSRKNECCYERVGSQSWVRCVCLFMVVILLRDCLCTHIWPNCLFPISHTYSPDTGDLAMRFGLHSGPVTAGVLRGDRARFQLFGDTVNTGKICGSIRCSTWGSIHEPHNVCFAHLNSLRPASRMESTGIKNKIQVSQATADLLEDAGKSHWLRSREDAVKAKGKGVLSTFWLNPSSRVEASVTSDESDPSSESVRRSNNSGKMDTSKYDKKKERLVDWMVELLLPQIKKIVSQAFRSTAPT